MSNNIIFLIDDYSSDESKRCELNIMTDHEHGMIDIYQCT